MIAEMNIPIQKVKHSKLKDLNLNGVPFGKYFSDHMLKPIMKMANGRI